MMAVESLSVELEGLVAELTALQPSRSLPDLLVAADGLLGRLRAELDGQGAEAALRCVALGPASVWQWERAA